MKLELMKGFHIKFIIPMTSFHYHSMRENHLKTAHEFQIFFVSTELANGQYCLFQKSLKWNSPERATKVKFFTACYSLQIGLKWIVLVVMLPLISLIALSVAQLVEAGKARDSALDAQDALIRIKSVENFVAQIQV